MDQFTDPGQTMRMWRMAQQVAKQHGTYGLFAPSQTPAKPQAMRQAPAKPPPAVPLPPFPGGK